MNNNNNNNNNSLIPRKGISRNGTIDLTHKNDYDKNCNEKL